jgi:hypothetical protein
MINSFVVKIAIPVLPDGTYDLEKQRELANHFKQIENIKNQLIGKSNELLTIQIVSFQ